MRLAALLLAAASTLAACSREGDSEGKRRLFSRSDETGDRGASFDFSRPASALDLDADEVARRLGSFEWSAAVEWSVSRPGDDAVRVRAVERHRVRQSATGEFEVAADVDPGSGPGSETGKEVVFAEGMTYARAKHAPFRERPTDRGRDARRFRDESFGLARDLARLFGGGLAVTPAGDATVLGRPAKRFKLSLSKEPSPPAPPRPRPAGAPQPDEDTLRRLRFLEGRVPTSADGELVLDAATGAPLRARLAGAFGVKDPPGVRTSVELLAQVRALGGEVAAIAAPKGALPDERKPAGVAAALDAAGLRKRDEGKAGRAEPADEPSD
jgi:hypothetical protein